MQPRPWKRACAWLAFLGPFFFASYGFANWLASRRAGVGAIAFGWEHRIPFVPWTIVPYWSIDLLYCISFFVCSTKRELDRHAQRLFAIQLICVAFFIAFPLRFSFDRPAAGGIYGALFAALGSFDKPFNQAPSLHIALLVAIWKVLYDHAPRGARLLLHFWMTLIGASILTTYQHHFLDLPTGFAVGFLVLWMLPEGESPLANARWTNNRRRQRLALTYAIAAIVCAAPATLGGAWLWMLWVAASLLIVAANYAFFGAHGFQKETSGALSLGATGLLLPYLGSAWINSRLWTWRHPAPAEVVEGLWIGRIPRSKESSAFAAVVDVTAEIPCRTAAGVRYRSVPMLDLVSPMPSELAAAADAIEEARANGTVLVCCALGYSRSAAAVVAWLLRTKRAASVDAAVSIVRKARPAIVLRSEHTGALETLA